MAVNETDGFFKIVSDEKTHEVLGVHIVGAEASDLISEGALALEMHAFLEDIGLTIHPHPTLGRLHGSGDERARARNSPAGPVGARAQGPRRNRRARGLRGAPRRHRAKGGHCGYGFFATSSPSTAGGIRRSGTWTAAARLRSSRRRRGSLARASFCCAPSPPLGTRGSPSPARRSRRWRSKRRGEEHVRSEARASSRRRRSVSRRCSTARP